MMARSWDGPRSLGLRREDFWRSLWVAGAALLFAAATVTMASHWHSLRLPQPTLVGMDGRHLAFGEVWLFARSYWAYALWTFIQQLLLQGFFLNRLTRVLPAPKMAALAGGVLFAVAHLPNPILTIATLVWGFAACLAFLRYRNLYSLAIAHAILGITIAITIPGPVIRNMRVGLGYMTYGQRHAAAVSLQPQRPDGVH
jgi:membrane protease YdiL (CAAX protease family)